MTDQTILRLNQLTTTWYQTIAAEFDSTRQQPWEGWGETVASILEVTQELESLKILDLGCGNGRWAGWLAELLPDSAIAYTGIDNEPQLLEKAAAVLPTTWKHQLLDLDIIATLLKQMQLPLEGMYHLIGAFGLIHHIPSQQLRTKLLNELYRLLAPQGLLILAAWQPEVLNRDSLQPLAPTSFGIDPEALEPEDMLLGWKNRRDIARFCHQLTDQEARELFSSQKWQVLAQFQADGKNHLANKYWVLQKPLQK